MFDQYGLIHMTIDEFELGDYGSRLSVSKYDEAASQLTLSAENYEAMHGTVSRLNGSFDILLLSPDHQESTEALFLQSFTVMENGRGCYTRRADYESVLLCYTIAGATKLQYGGKAYSLHEGEAFLIDCRRAHVYETAGDSWKHVDIHLWGRDSEKLLRHFSAQEIVRIAFPVSTFNTLIEKLLDDVTSVSDHRDLFVSSTLSMLLCALLDQAEKEGKSSVPLLYREAIRFLERNYRQPLSLDEISACFHLSKYHFSREFKHYTGFTPNDFVLNLRIRHACVLLSNTALSVEKIADEVGVNNMSNFIKQFKKRTGMTPSAFRKNTLGV